MVPVPWGLLSLSHRCLSCFFPPDDLIQLTAMCWMREFIQLAGRVMLPYSSGILTAVLPCLSYDDRKKSILVPELLPEAAGSPAESQSLPWPCGFEGRWGWGCSGSSAPGPLRHRACLGLRVPYTASTQTSKRWQTCATRA